MQKFLLLILFITSLFGAKYLAVLDLEPESISVSEARRELGKKWASWFKQRDYAPHEREDIVQADIMRYMRQEWGR